MSIIQQDNTKPGQNDNQQDRPGKEAPGQDNTKPDPSKIQPGQGGSNQR